MDYAQTEKLYKSGKENWNNWANGMIKKLHSTNLNNIDKIKSDASAEFTSRLSSGNSLTDFNVSEYIFPGDVIFSKIKFTGNSKFISANFHGTTRFDNCHFDGESDFNRVTFHEYTTFKDSIFNKKTYFKRSTFIKTVDFDCSIFNGEVYFTNSEFKGKTSLKSSVFLNGVDFKRSRFLMETSFEAIVSNKYFSLADSNFGDVPNFIQAHFDEPPRLDNVVIHKNIVSDQNDKETKDQIKESESARFRALRRLATQGHDHHREMEYFSGEMRSARGIIHFPFPWQVWKRPERSMLLWWLGRIYEITSNFGISIARPFAGLIITMFVFSIIFLGMSSNIHSCYSGEIMKGQVPSDVVFTGLTEPVRQSTNAIQEAMQLAFHNSMIFLDNGGDALHRTYGCLFGIERYNGSPIAYVPIWVSIASSIQKILSSLFIFLIALGLRNNLRMK